MALSAVACKGMITSYFMFSVRHNELRRNQLIFDNVGNPQNLNLLLYYLKVMKIHALDSLVRYRATFKNWLTVIIFLLLNKKNFVGILRITNSKIILQNRIHSWLVSYGVLAEFDKENESISFKYDGRTLIFKGAINNGDLAEVFGAEEFKNLRMKHDTVVDIGANIGDSSVYFAIEFGKVYAIEPFPSSFKYIPINAKINGLEDKIVPLNFAVGPSSNYIYISDEIENSTNLTANKTQGTFKVKVVTLSEIVKEYFIPKQSLLKIDCEGCEYEIFNSVKKETLNVFDEIIIECHKSFKMCRLLANEINELGYQVLLSRKEFKTGYIHAISKIDGGLALPTIRKD